MYSFQKLCPVCSATWLSDALNMICMVQYEVCWLVENASTGRAPQQLTGLPFKYLSPISSALGYSHIGQLLWELLSTCIEACGMRSEKSEILYLSYLGQWSNLVKSSKSNSKILFCWDTLGCVLCAQQLTSSSGKSKADICTEAVWFLS